MTDQSQNTGDPSNTNSLFQSSDQGTPQNKEFNLTEDQLQKILKQNSHAQDHIKNIENENAELRERILSLSKELEQSTQFDDLLEGLASQGRSSNTSEQTAPVLDKNQLLRELKNEIFNELTAAQTKALEEQNMIAAKNYLTERFGDNVSKEMSVIAEELSLSPQYIDQLASTSPKAFEKMIESVRPKTNKTTFSPTQTSFRTNPVDNTEVDLARVGRARNLQTEEGRQAHNLWQDPEFQRQQREKILARMRGQGSSFGNN